MSNEQYYWNQMYANACDENLIIHKPSVMYKPKIMLDGNKWCALYGENLQNGVAGFGNSPAEAMANFNLEWDKKL